MQNLSPENQLLLCCTRTSMNEGITEKARRTLAHSLDWNCLVKTASSHCVAPLVYNKLKRIGEGGMLPEEAMERLKAIYYATACRNIRMSQEVGKVLKAFNDVGVETIVLKGPALAQIVYKNPALRPFSDIDLLIKKGDLHKTKECLERLGYTAPANSISQRFYAGYHFNLSFVKKDKLSIPIEIHWDVVDSFKSYSHDISEIWDTACPVQISNSRTLGLSPETLLIYLCVHLDMHGYLNKLILNKELYHCVLNELSENRLIWFVDIHEVIQCYKEEIDWGEIIERSKRWGMEEAVYSGLSLTNELFGSLDGVDVTRYITAPRLNRLENRIAGFIINRRFGENGENAGWFYRFFTSKILRRNKRLQFRPIRILDVINKLSLLR